MRTREQCSGRLRGAKAAPARTPLLSGLWLSGLNNAGKRGKMVQAATLAPAAAPSPSRQKGQPAKRGALQRVAPPALEAPEEAAEAPAAAPAVEAPAGAAAADALPPDDTSDGESAESDALGETLSLPRAPTPVVDAGDPEDEDGGDYFYGDDDDDDASDADAPGSDAVLARELAEQFALEDLQEQRRELLGSFAMTLVARANSASRAVHSPRQLVRHRELLAQVSESMDLLHSLMPALEATGLVPAASMNVRPETHKGLLPQQVAELPRCRGADRPTVSKCAKHDDDEACAICLCEIAEDEEVIALPCRHSYHARCVGDWLQRSPTCPSCSLDVAKALDIELAPTAAEQRERANRHRILYFPTQEELEDEQEEFRRELDDSEDDEEALMREEEELLRAEEEELALRAEAQDDVDAMLHRAEDQMLQAERELEAEELAAAQLD